jgi:multidrug efflux pump subunit AcrA (membrane-fusion protein)
MKKTPLWCLVIGVALGSGGLSAASESAREIPGEATPVKVLTLKQYDTSEVPVFSGRVEAGDSAVLAFRVSGQLQELKVLMGQVVAKGTVLAELDPTDYRLNLEARQAEYDLASLGAERADSLFRQQPILDLHDNTRLDIRFNLPSQYESLLNGPSLAAFKVEFDLLPGILHEAQYKEVSLQPDPDTNSYPMTLVVNEPAHFTSRPGMSVNVQLHHPSLRVGRWLLPEEALIERSGSRAYVWRINADQLLERTAITLDEAGFLESGLNPGDRIVAAGVAGLGEAQKVRAWVREGGL